MFLVISAASALSGRLQGRPREKPRRRGSAACAEGRATQRIIRQNLAWAFGYNLVLVPLAMVSILPPIVAALAMACSSVTVVLNALRLRHFSPQRRQGSIGATGETPPRIAEAA